MFLMVLLGLFGLFSLVSCSEIKVVILSVIWGGLRLLVDKAVILKDHLLLMSLAPLDVTILSIDKLTMLLLELMVHLVHLSVVLRVNGLIGLNLLLKL